MNDHSKGLALGLTSYTIWGGFALLFSLLSHIPATEVLLHRVLWSFLFVAALLVIQGRRSLIGKAVRRPRVLLMLSASSMLIACNWVLFIWAVGQNRAIEASLGYFISPLISVFLGVSFLKERLALYQIIAIGFAALGVLYKLLGVGELPWIALTLAITFGLYGLIRKQVQVDALTGLLLETALLVPLAIGYWLWLSSTNNSHFTEGWNILLLIGVGVLTAIPLLTFSASTKLLSLTLLGFIAYIGPTLQLITATLILHEPFRLEELVTFTLIWTGLVFLSGGAVLRRNRFRLAQPKKTQKKPQS